MAISGKLLLALCICAAAGVADAARLLRQDVHTVAGPGKNPVKGLSVYAQAHEAESKSNPSSTGIFHNEASVLVQSGGIYPAPRNSVGTHNAEQPGGKASSSGGVWGSSIIAMGVTANAATDTERARAMSGSEAMPVSTSGISEYTTSKATTAVLWDIGPLRKGTGLSKKVFTDSLSVNSLPPTSIGVSNIGGGPVAVAAAGMAVSVSAADSQDNASSITRRH